MQSDTKGIDQRGDAALAQAIATGAPVPTTEAQAKELRQWWGVWSFPDNDWCHTEDGCVFTAEEAHRIYNARPSSREVRPYPYPTPPPTPPASSGGEWMHEWNSAIGEWNVCGGNACDHAITCGNEDDAKWLRDRLNAADAMEQENKRLREALEAMLARDQKNTCQHSETHRGGMIWTICDACGQRWADEVAPFKPFEEPPEWTQAYAALRGGA